VQRLFSMFPSGWPGLGLLFLRLSVAGALVLTTQLAQPTPSGWTYAAAIVIAVTLCTGVFTPVGACFGLVSHAVIGSRASVGGPWLGAVFCLAALALVMLGPGAYSIDALRFGRRVVVPPPR